MGKTSPLGYDTPELGPGKKHQDPDQPQIQFSDVKYMYCNSSHVYMFIQRYSEGFKSG